MSRMPGAEWRPLPASSTRITQYDITCFHTMVGSLDGTDNYFRTQATGTNSHFGVGADGTIYQWVDTAYRSGANYSGNWHIISVECADTGAGFPSWTGSDVPAWTPEQVDACARIARWAHDTHGIPLEQIPDSRLGRRGVGYHRLGVPGYMVAGSEAWSTKLYKACPGDRRIAQVPEVIARACEQGEDDMPSAQEVAKAVLAEVVTMPDKTSAAVRTVLGSIVGRQKSQQQQLDGIEARLASIESKVTAPPETPLP